MAKIPLEPLWILSQSDHFGLYSFPQVHFPYLQQCCNELWKKLHTLSLLPLWLGWSKSSDCNTLITTTSSGGGTSSPGLHAAVASSTVGSVTVISLKVCISRLFSMYYATVTLYSCSDEMVAFVKEKKLRHLKLSCFFRNCYKSRVTVIFLEPLPRECRHSVWIRTSHCMTIYLKMHLT